MRRVRHGFMTHPFFEVVSGSAFIPCIIQIPADLPPARRSGGFAIRRNSKPLSKILFTLHRKVINICSLETCTDEEITSLFTTLHPLFTWIVLFIGKRLRIYTIVDFSFIRTFAL